MEGFNLMLIVISLIFCSLLQVLATNVLLSAHPHNFGGRSIISLLIFLPGVPRLAEQQYSPLAMLPKSEATLVSSGTAPLWSVWSLEMMQMTDVGNAALRKGKVCLKQET